MLKKGIIALFVRFFGAITNLALNIYLARNMIKEEYGGYQLVTTIVTGLSLISRMGIDSYLLIDLSGKVNKKYINKKLRESIALVLMVSFVMVIFLSAILIYKKFYESNIYIMYMVFAMIPNVIYVLISSFQKALTNTVESVVINSVLFSIIMLMSVYINNDFMQEQVALIYLKVNAVVALVSILLVSKYLKIDKKLNLQFREIMLESVKYLPHSLLTYILLWVDILLVGFILTGEDVAEYSVASKITLVILLAMQVYDSLISPEIIKKYKKQDKKVFIKEIKKFFLKTVMYILFFVIFIMSFLEKLLELFGSQYLSVINCAHILILAYAVKGLASLPGYVLMAMNKVSYVNKILLFSLIINVLISFLLIGSLKIIGVAIGTFVSCVFIALCSYYIMAKSIKNVV